MRHRLGVSGRNLLTSSAAEVLVRATGFVSLVVLARYLHPAAFGTFNVLLAYLAIGVGVGSFGIDRLALRDFSNRSRRPEELLPTLLSVRILTAALTGCALILFGSYGSASWRDCAIIALALLPASASALWAAPFYASERFGVPALAATLSALIMAGLAIGGAIAAAPYTFFIWSIVAAETTRAAVLASALSVYRIPVRIAFVPADAAYAIRAALPYGVLALLTVLYFRIDLLMLDLMIGGAAVGHYASAYRILEVMVLIPGWILAVLYPRIARSLRERSGEALSLYLNVSRIVAWSGLLIAATGMVLAPLLFPLIFSKDYSAGVPVFLWLMGALFFFFLNAPNLAVLGASDVLRRMVQITAIMTLSNIALNILLIPRYAAVGAAIATAASELFAVVLFTPVVCRQLGASALQYASALQSPFLNRAELDLLLDRAAATDSA